MDFYMYLDSAATTKPSKEVISAMLPYLTDEWFNPSSLYSPSVRISKDIQSARETIAQYIGADSDEIYFTSSGSESNCWAIQGFIQNRLSQGNKPYILTTPIEHKSIIDCVKKSNVEYEFLKVDKDGFVDLNYLKECLEGATHANPDIHILVSVQFANNEIGTIQYISEIAEIIHKYNAWLHTDAVQAFGQVPIDVKLLGIDMLSASGHKVHTPKGIGVLYKKNSMIINPLIYGSQENNLRGGTENVPYIMGFKKAVEILQSNDFERRATMIQWRDDMVARLKELGCIVHGSSVHRLPNNINVAFPQKATGEALIYMLDMSGIYISAGSACNSHSASISHVLQAIGLDDDEALRTIRITLSDTVPIDEREEYTNTFISEFKKQLQILDISQKRN